MALMNFGVTYPQTEMPADRDHVVRFFRAAEEAGFQHITAYDHVLGADVSNRPDWPKGRYTVDDSFREPFVLFGFAAALVDLEFMTAVLVLPQRQTALVAKQAAELSLFTGGRFHLGVGVGWNDVEYEALDASFSDRGARIEEQIEVLRLLWTHDVVRFDGRFHRIDAAGIEPRPAAPVPIWLGGGRGAFAEGSESVRRRARRVLDRVARLADGWMPNVLPGPEQAEALAYVRTRAGDLGRDPASIGLQGNVFARRDASDDALHGQIEAWLDAGATRITVNAIGGGFTPDEHVEHLARAGKVVARYR
jgi:probable F420-dependent oxidoreductase